MYQVCLFLRCGGFLEEGENLKTLRTRIKELRAKYNFTQEDLARKVGVRRETIVFIEKGNYNPSLRLAHDIAKVLQSTIDELFIFEDNCSQIKESISKK